MAEGLFLKSANDLSRLIRSRAVSPVEVVKTHLDRIDQINPALNAIVTIAPDALDRARELERKVIEGGALGPLHGVPLTIKDTIATAGIRSTSGSRLLEQHKPVDDAPVVARLIQAGAIVLGKTNTPEMAIPYETDNPIFGRTNNPHDLKRTPGGSSGGEAAAIAAHLSPAGIGSDLSGSIRVPAHFCGIAGLKPTTGRVPMDGHLPAATGPLSFGAGIGPMARQVIDLVLLLGVIADEPPVETTANEFAERARQRLKGVDLAYYFDDHVAPVTEETTRVIVAAAKILEDAGLHVREAHPPAISEGSRLWIELFSQAASAQFRELYRGKQEKAGPQVASVLRQPPPDISFEARIKAAEKLAKAVVERERRREELLRWMKKTPLMIAPVGAVPAFEHGAGRVTVGGESISVFRAFSYSQTFNVFGLPAVSVPVGHSAEGLPIGVQIVGRPFEDDKVLAAAAIIEQAIASH